MKLTLNYCTINDVMMVDPKKGSDADDDNTQTGGNGGGNGNPPSGELEG